MDALFSIVSFLVSSSHDDDDDDENFIKEKRWFLEGAIVESAIVIYACYHHFSFLAQLVEAFNLSDPFGKPWVTGVLSLSSSAVRAFVFVSCRGSRHSPHWSSIPVEFADNALSPFWLEHVKRRKIGPVTDGRPSIRNVLDRVGVGSPERVTHGAKHKKTPSPGFVSHEAYY